MKSYHHMDYRGAKISFETTDIDLETWKSREEKMTALVDVTLKNGITSDYIIGEYYRIDFTDLIQPAWKVGRNENKI